MNRKTFGTIAAGALIACVLGLSALALGRPILGATGPTTIHVRPGQSIQAAIDRARSGDTVEVAPGIYRENLTVTTDGITLKGAGASSRGTALVPPAQPAGRVCDFEGMNGICVTGEFTPNSDEVGTPVRDVTVSGFAVRGFPRFGVLVNNAIGATISGNGISGAGAYGMAGFYLRHVRLLGNSSHDNGQGGFYLADSPKAYAVVKGNRSYRNATSEGFGLFVRDASHGLVQGNRFESNCVGLMLLSTSAGSLSDWTVRDNAVRRNSQACPASDDIPVALSGLGIGVGGGSHVHVSENDVVGNAPSGDTVVAGGIVVISAESFGGADSAAVLVRNNRAKGNAPADVVYDGKGQGNRFAGNACGNSLPAGLCN